MSRIELALLGGFAARLESGGPIALPTKKAQALLAYLAMPPGQPHARDALGALLWGDMGDAQARGSVRKALSWLRRELGDALVTEGHDVSLDPGRVVVDVQAFERGATEADPDALDAATRLYAGDFLAGLALREPPFTAWLDAERERLRELATGALARVLAHRRAARAHDAAIAVASRLVGIDPLRESAHRALIALYAETGRRAAALRQYQVCVAALARDGHTEPDAETKALYQDVLRGRSIAPGELSPPPEPRAAERSGPADSPLVGRAREIELVDGEIDAALAGRARLVMLLGEAGIGKSRLAAEVVARARRRGARAVIGHCYETERLLPFGPWVDALRASGLARDATLLGALEPVWRAELARLLPELGGEAQAAGPGEALHLFEAVARLLERAAAREPLIVVLEDVHWADEMSLRLTHALARRLAASPVLLLATLRDDEAASPTLRQLTDDLAHEGLLTRVPLDPLSREETVALVARLGPAAPEATLAERVWQASEGHPLIAVEALRATGDDAGAQARALPLSDRVHALITRRLDRLDERGQRLVAVAAVIGRQFEFALLHRASDLGEDDAAEGVEALVRRRVLQQAGDGLAFAHDQIRAVAYGALLRPRRALLHRRVAEAMESLAGPSPGAQALAIGTHYREGGVWDKAVAFLARAGFFAAARASTRDAVGAYEAAQRALRELPETPATLEQAADLAFSLAHARYVMGEFDAATEHYRAALELSRRIGDDRRRGYVLAGTSYLLDTSGEHAAAERAAEEARGLGEALGDRPLTVWASLSLGRACFAMGQHRRASEHVRAVACAIEGLPPGERFGRASILAAVATPTWLALSLARMGEFAEAVELGERAARLAREIGGPAESVAAHYALGRVHLGRAHFDRAIDVYEAVLVPCRAGSIPIYTPRVLASLASAYAQAGRLDDAWPLLDEALAMAAARRIAYGHSLVLVQFAETLLLANRREEARRAAQEAMDVATARGERGDVAWARHTLGWLATGDPHDRAGATVHYRAALDLAGALEMRPLAARCHLGFGTLLRDDGRADEARAHLAEAVAAFRAMGMEPWRARAEALLD